MERISQAEYLTALQGSLRALVALCALAILVVCANRRSHIPAFKYFPFFVGSIGLWGLFSGCFFIYPISPLLTYFRTLVYIAMVFTGPTFMLFCFAYALPEKIHSMKYLRYVFVLPCLISACALIPPLQKYFITYTLEIVYTPYRDIRKIYHILFYVHSIYGYVTALVGISVLAYKTVRHPAEVTTGSKLAMGAAALFVFQSMFSTFVSGNTQFFWIPTISMLLCIIFLFLTLYYDSTEQIIMMGQSALLETVPFPVLILNHNGIVIYTNRNAKNICPAVRQMSHRYIYKEDILQNFNQYEVHYEIDPRFHNLEVTSQQFIQRKEDGALFFLQDQKVMEDGGQHKMQGFLLMFMPLNSMQTFFSTLETKAFRDALCDCYNRHYLEFKLKELPTKDKFPVSLLMCDLDNLKQINDVLGHNRGDEYIIMCHNEIRSCLRKHDLVFRIGGDEFLVLLPRTPESVVQEIAQAIDERVAKHTEFDPYKIGISVGAATSTSLEKTFEDCLKEADEAMYRKKAEHKGNA